MIPQVRIAIAVFLGLVVTGALSIGTDFLMVALGIFPRDGDIMANQGLLALASVYRAVFSVVGAFVASLVAREFFRRAVLILGGIATLLAVLGIFAMWNKWNAATAWYPISLAVLALPCCFLGGLLYGRSRAAKPAV